MIRFDLSGLRENVISARIEMHGIARGLMTPNTKIEGNVGAYQILAPWEEFKVTWNDPPEISPEAIDVESPVDEGWYRWDITDLYRRWKSGETPNHGILLINHLEPIHRTGIVLKSSEHERVDLHPRLLLVFRDTRADLAILSA